VEPLEIMSNYVNTGINPFEVSKKVKSNVMRKLADLESTIQGPEMVKSISGVKLSQDEHEFFTDVWTGLNKNLEKWVGSKSFDTMPEGMQLTQLEASIALNKRIAESQTELKFERLRNAAFNAKLNAVRSLSKPEVAKTGLPNLFNLQGNQ
jgi:hypothetical protein